MPFTFPDESVLRSDNRQVLQPGRAKGFPPGFHHQLKGGAEEVLHLSAYQTEEEARECIPGSYNLFVGDKQIARVRKDKFGNALTQTEARFAKRDSTTVRALLPEAGYPRYQSVRPTHLTEKDILSIALTAIEKGMDSSWAIVRPTFHEIVGEILCVWPRCAPSYGAACIAKLGESVEDLSCYTEEHPFDPSVIWIGMPYLSDLCFGGAHTILCGSGKKRITVVNGGLYDGGCKKPGTFQLYDRKAPSRNLTTQHLAMVQLRDGCVAGIGFTTAAGKSEGSVSEQELENAGSLIWTFGSTDSERQEGAIVDISISGALANREKSLCKVRRPISDDITIVGADLRGRACGSEVERVIFYRDDDAKRGEDGRITTPLAEACVHGQVAGPIDYYNMGFDENKQLVLPEVHEMLDGTLGTNPRRSYLTSATPNLLAAPQGELMEIKHLILSIPVPAKLAWSMPSFALLTKTQLRAQCCHGARANKGNPALGAEGQGDFAFEGFGGKKNFSLASEARQFERDRGFWNGLAARGSYWVVFNGASMGGRQDYKYSATFLLRCLLENWSDEMLAAPLIKVPGAFNGGVPDLRTFLPSGALDERVWNPELLNPKSYRRDASMVDGFCMEALNRIYGQHGLSENGRDDLGRMIQHYIRESDRSII